MNKFVLFFLCCGFIILILNGFFIHFYDHNNFKLLLAQKQESQSLEVEHFFTHEIVYSAEKAFSNKNSLRNGFDRDRLTAKEFKEILNEFYKKGYVLVNLEDVYIKTEKGFEIKKELDFGGKKPLILSFDDMTYDTKGRGIVEKIVVKDGELYDYTSVEEEKYSQDRDCLTILEQFISKNPDFSYNGARAILCVTGYNGILGHRIFNGSYLSEKKFKEEERELKELIKFLEEKGYKFASHTYGHLNTVFVNYEKFNEDVKKWENEVEKYVGKTEIFCYPEGAHKSGGENNELLKQNGFKIFLCTGSKIKSEEEKDDVCYLYRHPLDGRSLRNCEKEYAKYFNTKEIYDSGRQVSFDYKDSYA